MQLVAPTVALHRSYLDAVDEFGGAHRDGDGDWEWVDEDDRVHPVTREELETEAGFARFVADRVDLNRRQRPGFVPCTFLWMVEDGTYLGSLAIRHDLNDFLRREGGHIGYCVRPSARRRGHASEALRQSLAVCRTLGLDRVLVTCNDDNIGSATVIETNGGVLEDTVTAGDGRLVRRYWIRLDVAPAVSAVRPLAVADPGASAGAVPTAPARARAENRRPALAGPTDPRIRPARPADVPAILRLVRALAAYEKEPDAVDATEADFRRALFPATGAPTAYAHVGEVDGEVVAMALWFLTFSTWTGKPGVHLEDLFVDPDYRSHGLGKALLLELARVCVERRYTRLEWWVLTWNTPSIEFYEALGARALDEWIAYRVDGATLTRLGGGA